MKHILTFTAAMILAVGTYASGQNGNTTGPKEDGKVTELTSEDFSKKVYDINAETLMYLGDKPAIIDFNATWCGPCRKIAPILEELAAEYAGQIVIYSVDVDKCGDVAAAFGISSIPAILYIPTDGDPQMTVGSRGKDQFKEEIQQILLKK